MNKSLASLWGTTVPLSLSIFFYTPVRLSFYQNQKQNTDTKAFNLTFRYIDDVLQINNPNFVNCILLIYHKDIEITKTTETASSASFLDIYHKLDTNAGNGQLFTRLYGKGDDFNFVIINFPHLYNNLSTALAYVEEEFDDTKEVIRIRILKNRQHNDQKIRDKRTNNNQHNIHIQIEIE